jgi:hypothetical protein
MVGYFAFGKEVKMNSAEIITPNLPMSISDDGHVLTVSSKKSTAITGPIMIWSVTNEQLLWEIWKKDSDGSSVFKEVSFKYGEIPEKWRQYKPKNSQPHPPSLGDVILVRTGYRVTKFLTEGFGDSHSAFRLTEHGWKEIPVKQDFLKPLVKYLSEL